MPIIKSAFNYHSKMNANLIFSSSLLLTMGIAGSGMDRWEVFSGFAAKVLTFFGVVGQGLGVYGCYLKMFL